MRHSIVLFLRTRLRSWLRKLCVLAVFPLLAWPSPAQVPNVQLPQVPQVRIPASDALGAANETVGRTLRDARQLRIRQLLRTNRSVLETDPRGAPIVRAEITAFAPTEASLQRAKDAGFTVVRETLLPGLDIRIVVLAPRANTSTRAALRRLRRLDPEGSYDYNHLYMESGAVEAAPTPTSPIALSNAPRVAIGLIDTGIDRGHPSLQSVPIEQWGCESQVVPAAHGTAVASLLAGNVTTFHGAALNASLYAADVYCGNATGGSVDRIAIAFAWLAERRISVINVSLVGPPNVLLEKIVATMIARGHLIVAAVGNDGPASPPLYPAAYPGVIGVTGVDSKRRVLVEALRGKQVIFAAPGAEMAAAGLQQNYVSVRGTSFAAPIVAGLLAEKLFLSRSMPEKNSTSAQIATSIVEACSNDAIDLGSKGIDKVYGRGLIGETVRVAPDPLLSKK